MAGKRVFKWLRGSDRERAAGPVGAGAVARARQGEQAAFAALYNSHKASVYELCLRVTGDVEQAEGLTAEAFMGVFRKLEEVDGEAGFSAELRQIAAEIAHLKHTELPAAVGYPRL